LGVRRARRGTAAGQRSWGSFDSWREVEHGGDGVRCVLGALCERSGASAGGGEDLEHSPWRGRRFGLDGCGLEGACGGGVRGGGDLGESRHRWVSVVERVAGSGLDVDVVSAGESLEELWRAGGDL